MRKIPACLMTLLAAVTVLSAFLTGCAKPVFDVYFNDFASTEGYSSLEATLTLPEGVFVESYFEDADRFSVKKETGLKDDDGNPICLYGIASRTELLIEPSFLWIYDVSGDYAIVSKLTLDENSQIVPIFGLIRIYGRELYSYMTTFEHNLVSEEFLPIRFTGGYVAVLGDRFAGGGADRFTFYDREMNEAFRLKATVFSTFFAADGYLVHYTDTTKAEFYRTDNKDGEGFLTKTDDYEPFSEDDLTLRRCSITINYLGNGWFLRTASVASDSDFAGCNVILNESAERYPYVKNTSDRYNADSRTQYNNQSLMPVLAVNKYVDKEMRELASYYNAVEIPSEEDGKAVYRFPVYPVSALVKDGYTLVYTYYYIDEASRAVDISFAVLEGTAKEPVVLRDLYMPLLFIDGVGFEVDSPYFSPVYYQAGVYDKKGGATVLERAVEDYSYASVKVSHGGMTVVDHVDLLAAGSEETTYEAFRGSERAVAYGRYKEFTPYFSGYATASVFDKKSKKRTFYSVGEGGGETKLENVFKLKNGVYLTENTVGDEKRYGLSNNAGKELIGNLLEEPQVLEFFLKDGKFIESLFFTKENGRGVIYRLI